MGLNTFRKSLALVAVLAIGSGFAPLFEPMCGVGAAQAADKDSTLQGVELGLQYPGLLGDAALKFDRSLGITANVYLNRSMIHHSLEPVVGLHYQGLGYKNVDGFNLQMFSLLVGVRAIPTGRTIFNLLPYLGVHLGPMLNWVQTTAAGASFNTSLGGHFMVQPGIEYVLSPKMILNLSFPLIWVLNRDSSFAYVTQNLAFQYRF